MKSEELLNDLIALTKKNLDFATRLRKNSLEELNWRKNRDSWSALQCIEHLNLYGIFYLPEIEKSILKSKHSAETNFKSGFLGNRFAESMLPGEQMKKIKTFKSKNPSEEKLTKDILQEFIIQQQKLLQLLESAKRVNLNKARVPVSIAKWLKLKLGDIFRVVIYHNERHLVQASNTMKKNLTGEGAQHLDFT
ncbi:DinB family protein [Maribacter sp. 2210JD10-5]|uniref:DinB family protein n=1 Tax=Maribacter sp. 2210JD10-5 TaxID=3386272 RepID=UPI0039BCEE3A